MKKICITSILILGASIVSLIIQGCGAKCSKAAKTSKNQSIYHVADVSVGLIKSYVHDSIDFSTNVISPDAKEYSIDSLFIKISIHHKAVAIGRKYSFANLYACDIVGPTYYTDNLKSIEVFSNQDWNSSYLAGSDLSDIIHFKHLGTSGFKKANPYLLEITNVSGGFIHFAQKPTETKTHDITMVYNFGSYKITKQIFGIKIIN